VQDRIREDRVHLARAFERNPAPLRGRERRARVEYARATVPGFDAELSSAVQEERRRARQRRRGLYR
jgi:hypothetical protein